MALPRVLKYSHQNLLNCILGESKKHLKSKFHFEVLKDYFNEHKASTIIVEEDYYSESYVSDLSLYYTFSNSNFTKYCKRIHIIKGKTRTRDTFLKAIINLENTEIIDDYIGYIVVKPLPETIIGATLLKTYDSNPERHYNSIREYNLNFFGRRIKFDTLIFQEQDKNVAACATCAIWFASHYYVYKTNSPKLSLYEITKLAGSSNKGVLRMFPSLALDEFQIATAIRNLGLDFEPVNKLNNLLFFKAYLYSYNRGGTPILLGVYLPFLGYHLVTVVGYRIDLSILDSKINEHHLKLRSSLISKIYVHDEHTGPFARIDIIENTKSILDFYEPEFKKLENSQGSTQPNYKEKISKEETPKNNKTVQKLRKERERIQKANYFLKLSWKKSAENVEYTYGIVKDIFPVIPPIIRISYKTIFKIIKGDSIRDLIEYITQQKNTTDDLFWDIHLSESNKYKESLLTLTEYADEIRFLLLSRSFPKYVWIARGYLDNNPFIEFIFDATDLHTNLLCREVIIFGMETDSNLFEKVNFYTQVGQKYSNIIEKLYFNGKIRTPK